MRAGEALLSSAGKAFGKGFDAILEIAPTEAAPFFIDGRGLRCSVLAAIPENCAPDGVWRAGAETLARIFEGGRALESAYLSGRLKISGDMSLMARLILESST